MELTKEPEVEYKASTRELHIIWLSLLRSLMATARNKIHASKIRYKCSFDEKIKIPGKKYKQAFWNLERTKNPKKESETNRNGTLQGN